MKSKDKRLRDETVRSCWRASVRLVSGGERMGRESFTRINVQGT